jgi:hypothetical protein
MDAGFSIDRSNDDPCPIEGVDCLWLTDFQGGTQLSFGKYSSRVAEPFASPVAPNLSGSTTIDLFHRCDFVEQGTGTKQGTLSWGEVEMTAAPQLCIDIWTAARDGAHFGAQIRITYRYTRTSTGPPI